MKLDRESLPFITAVLIVLLFAATPFVAAALLDRQAEYYGLGVGIWGLTMWFVYAVLGVTAGVAVRPVRGLVIMAIRPVRGFDGAPIMTGIPAGDSRVSRRMDMIANGAVTMLRTPLAPRDQLVPLDLEEGEEVMVSRGRG